MQQIFDQFFQKRIQRDVVVYYLGELDGRELNVMISADGKRKENISHWDLDMKSKAKNIYIIKII